MPDQAVVDRLLDLTREVLDEMGESDAGGGLGPDAFLPDWLDSVGFAALVDLIEQEWGVVIKDEELEPAVFETPVTIASMIERKTTG